MLNTEGTYASAVEKTVQYLRMRRTTGSRQRRDPDAMGLDDLWRKGKGEGNDEKGGNACSSGVSPWQGSGKESWEGFQGKYAQKRNM